MSGEDFSRPLDMPLVRGPGHEPEFNTVTTIETHSGRFHLDEMLAVAVLKDLFPEKMARSGKKALSVVRFIRERAHDETDPVARQKMQDALASLSTMVLDKGHSLDPARLNFDHHQGGVSRSTAGLIWAAYGRSWLSSMAFHMRHTHENQTNNSRAPRGVNLPVVPPITSAQLDAVWERMNREVFDIADAQDVGALRSASVVAPDGTSYSLMPHVLSTVVRVSNRPRLKSAERDQDFSALVEDQREYLAAYGSRAMRDAANASGSGPSSYAARAERVLGDAASRVPSRLWDASGRELVASVAAEAAKVLVRDALPSDALEATVREVREKYWKPMDVLVGLPSGAAVTYGLADGRKISSDAFDQLALFDGIPRPVGNDSGLLPGVHPKFESYMRHYTREVLMLNVGELEVDRSALSLSHGGRVLIYNGNEPIVDAAEVLRRIIKKNPDEYARVVQVIYREPMRDDAASYYWVGPVAEDSGDFSHPLPIELRGMTRADPLQAEELAALGYSGIRFVSQTGHVAQVDTLEQSLLLMDHALDGRRPRRKRTPDAAHAAAHNDHADAHVDTHGAGHSNDDVHGSHPPHDAHDHGAHADTHDAGHGHDHAHAAHASHEDTGSAGEWNRRRAALQEAIRRAREGDVPKLSAPEAHGHNENASHGEHEKKHAKNAHDEHAHAHEKGHATSHGHEHTHHEVVHHLSHGESPTRTILGGALLGAGIAASPFLLLGAGYGFVYGALAFGAVGGAALAGWVAGTLAFHYFGKLAGWMSKGIISMFELLGGGKSKGHGGGGHGGGHGDGHGGGHKKDAGHH